MAPSDCIPCARGRFCRYASMYSSEAASLTTAAAFLDPEATLGATTFAKYAAPCAAGYVCLAGASSATPSGVADITGYRCPKGHFCDGASLAGATPCHLGTMQPAEQSATCPPCPAGSFCSTRGAEEAGPCPAGAYCPAGSTRPASCPAGTYRASSGGETIGDCAPCSAGKYCELPGGSAATGPCKAGFLCGSGSATATPWAFVWGAKVPATVDPATGTSIPATAGTTVSGTTTVVNGLCPAGHYCPQGAAVPTPCPLGSYNPTAGAAECIPCDPGHYCGLLGLTAAGPRCAAGFYCKLGAKTAAPAEGATGGPCPAGQHCPAGSAIPLACPDGTRTTAAAQGTCPACAAGKSCRGGLIVSCDNYRYCSESENAAYPYGRLCPAGTYLLPDARGTASASGCTACPAGKYCRAGRVAGDCAAGYICSAAAPSPTPTGASGSSAYACPIGYYCPQGTESPKRCASGLYTYNTGARQKEECSTCQGGYWCE